ncbi:AbrB/MazE/SpoVT family DNA-binding domain-containing protein [Salinarchaeum laminariae]|uniref:AbrB/MazE/SpoVT family DNA-binding domain-containing protein n=1 Tax=Salinarchaeum laminariae TaxID=869888 RepID=UPI0020BDB2C5|nr:AbrB/MazE/SpoVT family DNA-binding domain-containing protein [Salinarchaeum laminariae]
MSTDEATDKQTTRITRKGQVTIPKELRDAYALEEGDELVWIETEDGIEVRKATQSAGRGLLVEDGTSRESRDEMADAMEAEIRAKRRAEWTP